MLFKVRIRGMAFSSITMTDGSALRCEAALCFYTPHSKQIFSLWESLQKVQMEL